MVIKVNKYLSGTDRIKTTIWAIRNYLVCVLQFHVSASIKFVNKWSPVNLVLYTDYTQYKQIIKATQYYSKLLGTQNVVIQLRVWPTLLLCFYMFIYVFWFGVELLDVELYFG